MTVPDRVTADWIATLGNAQLVDVESRLHAEFQKENVAEKRRAGSRYTLLQGPTVLVNAWLRWLLVSNEARSRGLVVRHQKA
jgi:hypothetical protein